MELRCETGRYNAGHTEYEYHGKVDTLVSRMEGTPLTPLLKPRRYLGAQLELTDEFFEWLETNYGPDGGQWAFEKVQKWYHDPDSVSLHFNKEVATGIKLSYL